MFNAVFLYWRFSIQALIDIRQSRVSFNISKTPFLDDLCAMVSWNSIEKDSIATTRSCFKDCFLACKIRNQMHKVPPAASGNFTRKWLFCKIHVFYNICSFICGRSSWKKRSYSPPLTHDVRCSRLYLDGTNMCRECQTTNLRSR